jgi:hypothetical protein
MKRLRVLRISRQQLLVDLPSCGQTPALVMLNRDLKGLCSTDLRHADPFNFGRMLTTDKCRQ